MILTSSLIMTIRRQKNQKSTTWMEFYLQIPFSQALNAIFVRFFRNTLMCDFI